MKLKCSRIFVSFSLCLLLLAGCGFHLRGASSIPPQMHILYLEMQHPYSEFGIQLQQNLISAGINLVNAQESAPVTLHIIDETFSKQLSGISGTTQVRTYTLVEQVTFELKNKKGSSIYGPKTVATTASYMTGDNQLLADSRNLTQQRRAMVRDVISRMFDMISSKQGKEALMQIR